MRLTFRLLLKQAKTALYPRHNPTHQLIIIKRVQANSYKLQAGRTAAIIKANISSLFLIVLIDMSMNQQEDTKRLFLSACADGDIDEVRRLFSEDKTLLSLSYDNSDMDSDSALAGMTPLTIATLNGHIQTVRFLLDEGGADVNKSNRKV